jgi:thioester reductase-like protein
MVIHYFDHTSTLSVQVSSDQSTGLLAETDARQQAIWVHGNYAQSKWGTDSLLQSALPLTFRLINRLFEPFVSKA